MGTSDRKQLTIYDVYIGLCNMKGKTPTAAAIEAGISKSLPTKWKNNPDAVPSGTVLKKLSIYFDTPMNLIYNPTWDYDNALAKGLDPSSIPDRKYMDDEGNIIGEDTIFEKQGVSITKSDVLAAFYGGDEELTPEENELLFQDAAEYINFKRQQMKERKRKKE